MFKKLVLKNRSYRRFYNEHKIDRETLIGLVELARITPSARNKQPLKYIISNDNEECNFIFSHLKWAGYLKNWDGPNEDERPSAYITVLLDKNISNSTSLDAGIVSQTILLGAVEEGLGGCMIGSYNNEALRKYFKLHSEQEIVIVIALGKPKEEIVLEELPTDGNIQYWRDNKEVHHVPKRSIEDIIIK